MSSWDDTSIVACTDTVLTYIPGVMRELLALLR